MSGVSKREMGKIANCLWDKERIREKECVCERERGKGKEIEREEG